MIKASLSCLCDAGNAVVSKYSSLEFTKLKMGKIKGAVIVNTERCKGCNLCVVACPTGTLKLSETEVNHKGYAFCCDVHPENCIGCASCAVVCPDGCITVYKAKVDDATE